MKILVAITNYGTANDRFMERIIEEYRSMEFQVDIIVFSNVSKQVPAGVRLVVGLPNKDPWSLPFAHKSELAIRASEYDLFIYSEDDILITERNIRAFLGLSAHLTKGEIAGFLRYELTGDGRKSFPEFHGNYRWASGSLTSRGPHCIAQCTNEHSACYILTKTQLKSAIASGGFLVAPHQGKYDLACTAATDPYTQCGARKVICISHLDDFLVHHLPNKYVDQYGLIEEEFRTYMNAFIGAEQTNTRPWFRTDSTSIGGAFSKDYYEPARADVVSLISSVQGSVLSVGCGWGAAEVSLSKAGFRVTALPLDPAIASWVQAKGILVYSGDITDPSDRLAGRTFDCVLISNLLHLAADPVQFLSTFRSKLVPHGDLVVVVPNLSATRIAWKKMRRKNQFAALGEFDRCGVHQTSDAIVRGWFRSAGFKVKSSGFVVPDRLRTFDLATCGALRGLVSREMVVVGTQ
jgi:2-polyprenyl-3-methyl-5-hydroxy-6-metoxy-1,4-benzoquinol methylase